MAMQTIGQEQYSRVEEYIAGCAVSAASAADPSRLREIARKKHVYKETPQSTLCKRGMKTDECGPRMELR
jgi:hypothetical protein